VDRAPRELAPDQRVALKALSRLVLAQLEFRRNLILLKEALTDRSKEEHERQSELVHVQETLMRVMGCANFPQPQDRGECLRLPLDYISSLMKQTASLTDRCPGDGVQSAKSKADSSSPRAVPLRLSQTAAFLQLQ